MRDIIAFILGNFTLTFFVIGLFASAIALWRARRPRGFAVIVEALFSYFLLFSIGFSYLYNFVLHVFFGKLAASFIGWEDSPFQLEVGFASLGFAMVGFLAFKGSFDLRLAAIVGPACFLWGAAGVHVYQMVTAHNFAPRQRWHHFLQRLLGPDCRLHISLAATPLGAAAFRPARRHVMAKSASKHLHLRTIGARTNREHGRSGLARRVLWKSMMAQARDGDFVPSLGLGWLDQGNRRASWPVVSTR
jgi:hypothetical protein